MTTLFDILDGIIDNAGDMINNRAEVENALKSDAVFDYADGAMDIFLSTEQADKISKVGLQWVHDVNEGNGEWGGMRHTAEAELSDEV